MTTPSNSPPPSSPSCPPSIAKEVLGVSEPSLAQESLDKGKLPLSREEVVDMEENSVIDRPYSEVYTNDLKKVFAQARLAIDLKEMLDYMLSTHDFDCIEELREQQIEAKMKEYNKERLKEES